MASFRSVDYELSVTSQVRFLDGHFEDGPSTRVAGSFSTVEPGRQVLSLIQQTVGGLHHDSFGRRFRRDLRQLIVPADDADHAFVKLDITYYANLQATAYMNDGSVEDVSDYKQFTVPI